MAAWEITFVVVVDDAADQSDAVVQARQSVYRGWVEADVVEVQGSENGSN